MTHSTVRDGVRKAVELVAAEAHLASPKSGSGMSKVPVVVVCGTAFIMAEARAELGVQEPRDSESLSDPLSTDETSNVDSQVCVCKGVCVVCCVFVCCVGTRCSDLCVDTA